ncbi:MAG: hypothetical protein ACLQVI_39180 [Polyangiaceae bacterium]
MVWNGFVMLAGLSLAVACAGGAERAARAPFTPASPPATDYTPPPRSKESGCVARGPLPDPACTPGAVMTTDRDVICKRRDPPRTEEPTVVGRRDAHKVLVTKSPKCEPLVLLRAIARHRQPGDIVEEGSKLSCSLL